MTDLSGTPAEQWLSIDIRDAVLGDEVWDNAIGQWIYLMEGRIQTQKAIYSRLGMPCRRRIDPTLDPAEPLRRELREAYPWIDAFFNHLGEQGSEKIQAWLARNAAFGGQKGGE